MLPWIIIKRNVVFFFSVNINFFENCKKLQTLQNIINLIRKRDFWYWGAFDC